MILSTVDSLHKDTLKKSFPVVAILYMVLAYIASTTLFADKPQKVKKTKRLDITLLNIKSSQRPDKAELIAQVNTQASGTTQKKARPMSNTAKAQPEATAKKTTTVAVNSKPKKPTRKQTLVAQSKGMVFTQVKEPLPIKKPEKKAVVADSSVDDIVNQIAKLEAEIGTDKVNYNKIPTIRFLDTLAAKSEVEAEYVTTWARHVERIGTRYFPKKAAKQKLNGLLILQVILDHNGKVIKTEVHSSSGSSILDKGAMKIVELAQPFPPLPKAIRAKWDQLSITRTWVFRGDGSESIYTK